MGDDSEGEDYNDRGQKSKMRHHKNAVGLEDEELQRELITREEIYYTGKENIEGYACLVNIFMNSL